MFQQYDVIVVGAGHAGCEAAASAANMGSKVLLITMNMQTIAQMSCNPAMGGIAKGQIVREIDALGGYSGIVSDESTLQFRMLNRSKGPAMWSPRSQNDRMLFALKWRELLEKIPNIDFYQDNVNELLIKEGKCFGVITSLGHQVKAKAVIITSGTFLNGIIHIGEKQLGGGRVAEKSATGITEQLVSFGLKADRLKTGTPPRIDGRSLDYEKMEEQKGDEEVTGFSYLPTAKIKPEQQLSCHITYTNSTVHELLKEGFDRSPMYAGRIDGVGPRYCPSIEDKINRFAERERHQLFVEPEGFNTVEIYINGFSTSLPEEVQIKALRHIVGFEKCKMFRPGYAIEYDFFPPTQLQYNLETKAIQNLFFAGQINGTTGYEEAACQGLMAGMNAHLKINNQPPFVLKRSEAYIGVLIDDLISKGTDEPYRMFTSRAEYRTLLRQDNADIRLTALSHKLGLASSERLKLVNQKNSDVSSILDLMKTTSAEPTDVNEYLHNIGSTLLQTRQKIAQLILRPEVKMKDLCYKSKNVQTTFANFTNDAIEQAEILTKYDVYIEKEKEIVHRMQQVEDFIIPQNFEYQRVKGLGNEAIEKLTASKPLTLGQAGRISGINPSDIQILMVYLGR
jgi:tRNA uridine 5-carboxymethylaminomethyl modification enzyme